MSSPAISPQKVYTTQTKTQDTDKSDQNLYYFAYGSNMDFKQMDHRRIFGPQLLNSCDDLEVKKATVLGLAHLADYVLTFDKISMSRPTTHFASIKPETGSIVEGVLYQLDSKYIEILDCYEGVSSNQYTKEIVDVVSKSGSTLGQIFKAYVYIGHPNACTQTGAKGTPTQKYLDTLIRGAKLNDLSEEAVANLRNWPAEPT